MFRFNRRQTRALEHFGRILKQRRGLVLPAQPRRLEPDRVGGLDWHNDASAFLLDLKDALDKAGDDRARGVILRRVKKALDEVG